MTKDEYNLLFHQADLNLVAFKQLIQCDDEVLRLVNMAIQAEREACAQVCEKSSYSDEGDYFLEQRAAAIRARNEK